MDKYDCIGLCRYWQPLEAHENVADDILTRQQFMTPHIGANAKTYLRNVTLTLDDPMYNYHEESLLVVDRVLAASRDPAKMDLINYFHGTLNGMGAHSIRGVLHREPRLQMKAKHSYQDHLLLYFGVSLVEYDGMIQAWHEKVHHDLVRPTTVIRYWDDDILAVTDVQNKQENYAARDFTTHAPVPATAEFPSANSCICAAYAEFMDVFTTELYDETLHDLTVGSIRFDDMTDFKEKCGLSRLWSGVSYPASIEAGAQVCSGLGQLGFDYVQEVRNGSPSAWMHGDTLPECPR